MSADPNDSEPLTPGHFLYGSAPAALPEPPVVPKSPGNVNSIQLAYKMKFAAQELWNRFRREYFHLLQPRTKWLVKTHQFVPGSVVLIHEDHVDPLKWPVGRIIEANPDKKGIVRVVKVRTATGEYERSVNKVAVLPNEEWSDELTRSQRGGVC